MCSSRITAILEASGWFYTRAGVDKLYELLLENEQSRQSAELAGVAAYLAGVAASDDIWSEILMFV